MERLRSAAYRYLRIVLTILSAYPTTGKAIPWSRGVQGHDAAGLLLFYSSRASSEAQSYNHECTLYGGRKRARSVYVYARHGL